MLRWLRDWWDDRRYTKRMMTDAWELEAGRTWYDKPPQMVAGRTNALPPPQGAELRCGHCGGCVSGSWYCAGRGGRAYVDNHPYVNRLGYEQAVCLHGVMDGFARPGVSVRCTICNPDIGAGDGQ
jgi:hypothetical protein